MPRLHDEQLLDERNALPTQEHRRDFEAKMAELLARDHRFKAADPKEQVLKLTPQHARGADHEAHPWLKNLDRGASQPNNRRSDAAKDRDARKTGRKTSDLNAPEHQYFARNALKNRFRMQGPRPGGRGAPKPGYEAPRRRASPTPFNGG